MMGSLWYNKKLIKKAALPKAPRLAGQEKDDWQQANLQVGHSPLNLYYGAKRWFEKWDSRFKYNEFFLSWEVWWLMLWSIVYAVLMYYWLVRIWNSVPSSLPILFISHALDSVMMSRYWLIGIVSIPVLFAVAVLILTRVFGKSQKELAFLWVLFHVLLSAACFVTAFKIVTIFG